LSRAAYKLDIGTSDGDVRNQAYDAVPDEPKAFFDQFRGEVYSTDLMIREAERFVRDHQEEPFFLYYATPMPHVALQVPQDSLEAYLGLGWDAEPYLGNDGYLPHPAPRAGYAAMISRMDRNVGRLLDLLDELQLAEDTLVVFSSDNGTGFVSGVDYEFFDSVGELRGLKGRLQEGGIRVPMIARWPGEIEPGSKTDHLSYFPDVMPTLLEMAGRGDLVPAEIDGLSFAPTLRGHAEEQARHDYLYWEFPGYGGQQAIRMGRWKALRTDLREGDTDIELYDMASGAGERAGRLMQKVRTPSEAFPMQALDELEGP